MAVASSHSNWAGNNNYNKKQCRIFIISNKVKGRVKQMQEKYNRHE